MKILVLGGSRFIGRHIVEALLAAGHRVTVFNRGLSPDELPAGVERLRGDRYAGPAGLTALTAPTTLAAPAVPSRRRWDACIDVSGYTPRQVRASAELLCAEVERYVFVSAVMVYGDPQQRPVLETQARVPAAAADRVVGHDEIDGDNYGPLKVACEDIVQAVYGGRATILRPQVVAGPHDDSNRYTHWVQRAQRAGPMLAPGDGSDHLQVIDVRDLAAFVCAVVGQDLGGAFNLAGPRLTWAEFMTILGVEAPVWVPVAMLQAAALSFVELPLFRTERGPRAGLMDISSARAQAAGLRLSDPAVTARDVRLDGAARPWTPALQAPREAALIELASKL